MARVVASLDRKGLILAPTNAMATRRTDGKTVVRLTVRDEMTNCVAV